MTLLQMIILFHFLIIAEVDVGQTASVAGAAGTVGADIAEEDTHDPDGFIYFTGSGGPGYKKGASIQGSHIIDISACKTIGTLVAEAIAGYSSPEGMNTVHDREKIHKPGSVVCGVVFDQQAQ